ncbi:hypothetical protein GF420_10675 [candidate division GN15 bacterium]|nr:hypothetical protein [candidate division GN15 bacterium]
MLIHCLRRLSRFLAAAGVVASLGSVAVAAPPPADTVGDTATGVSVGAGDTLDQPAISASESTISETTVEPSVATAPDEIEFSEPVEPTGPRRAEPGEILFNEIELSPQGVVAYDTLGNRWSYDFQTDQFIEGTLPGGERSPADVVLPVEERATELLEVQPFASYVNVSYEDYVQGDVIATGRVVVQGWVQGDVRSYKRVLVTPSGRVDGDVSAPIVDIEEGGLVLGTVSETSNPMDVLQVSTVGIWVVVGIFVFWLIFTFVLVSLAPKQLKNIQSCVGQYQLKSFALGLLLLLLMGPAMAVFAVTLIGLVITILIPFAYLIAMSLGVVTFGNRVINRLMLKLFGRRQSQMFQSLLGVIGFAGIWFLVAVLMTSTDRVAHGFGVALLVVTILLSLYPVCTGLGAAFLTRFGFRPYVSYRDRQAPAADDTPAPPPIPKAPPVVGPPPTPPPSHRPGSSPLSPGND